MRHEHLHVSQVLTASAEPGGSAGGRQPACLPASACLDFLTDQEPQTHKPARLTIRSAPCLAQQRQNGAIEQSRDVKWGKDGPSKHHFHHSHHSRPHPSTCSLCCSLKTRVKWIDSEPQRKKCPLSKLCHVSGPSRPSRPSSGGTHAVAEVLRCWLAGAARHGIALTRAGHGRAGHGRAEQA
ncbi:hypothetical protein BKA80DRAFT_130237 [Phyllosticta citrichinensis]